MGGPRASAHAIAAGGGRRRRAAGGARNLLGGPVEIGLVDRGGRAGGVGRVALGAIGEREREGEEDEVGAEGAEARRDLGSGGGRQRRRGEEIDLGVRRLTCLVLMESGFSWGRGRERAQPGAGQGVFRGNSMQGREKQGAHSQD